MAVIKQAACLVFNAIIIDSYAFLFDCMTVGRNSECEMYTLIGFGCDSTYSDYTGQDNHVFVPARR